MKKITRAASAVLSLMLLASSFVGCSKNGKTAAGAPKTVEDNGQPFFSSEVISFEVPEKAEDVIWCSYTQPIIHDGKFYSIYRCDSGNLESKNNPGEIHIFDMDGKLVDRKDLGKVTKDVTKGADSCYLDTDNALGTKFLLTTYKEVKGDYKSTYFLYDFLTDEITPFDIGNTGSQTYIMNMKALEDGTIATLTVEWTEKDPDGKFTLILGDGKKVDKTIDLNKKLEKLEVSYISDMNASGNKLSFTAYDSDYSNSSVLNYDIKSGEFTKADGEEDDEVMKYGYNVMQLDGVKYSIDEKGFYRIKDGGDKEELVNFDNANVCLNKITYARLMSVTDDEILFSDVSYVGNDSAPYAIKLIKHDKNPNVGKELLVAASMSYMNDKIEESIVKFNNENDKVFIRIDRSYEERWDEYDDVDWRDDESYNKANELHTQNQADLVSQLAIDLMSGDGPDILFNCSGYSQLLKEECLLDMNDFIGEVLDTNDVFTNIVDGAKNTEGKLFTMPLLFSSQGLVVKNNAVSADKVGFTYDEYAKFVKDKCNGDDTFNYEGLKKTDYLEMFLNTEMDTFIHDGKADFDNEDFYALLEYVKSVPELKPSEEEDDPMIYREAGETESVAFAGWLSTFNDYAYYFKCSDGKTDYVYLGYPAAKPHGPLANIDLDVAISASCGSVDSAKEFLKIITGKDYMKVLSEANWSSCISKSATRENAKISLNQIMSERKMDHEYDPSRPLKKVTDVDIDAFINLLGSLDVKPAIDLSIVMIIKEESQAYFAGQKDAKEVAATISDRTQTVLNEKS